MFCAVTATSTVAAWIPWAAKVSRSAWIPAPPPESDMAIVTAHGALLRLFFMSLVKE